MGWPAAPSSQPPGLSQAALPLHPQRRGTVQDYISLQQIIPFSDGLGPKPCRFAAVSAYGSWASRMPGDTAGSQGEAAVHLTSSAMSLRRPTPSSPGPGPPESWFETRLGQLGSAGPPRGWRESVGPGWCRLPLRPCLLLQILTRTASSMRRTCKGSSFGCSTAMTCPRTCSLTSPAACVPGAAGWVCPWKAGRIRCPEGWVLGLEATTPCFLSYLQDLDSLPGSPEP